MADKKQLLRKTTALIISVVFMFSYSSQGMIIAEEVPVTGQVTDIPADLQEEVTEVTEEDNDGTVYPEEKPVIKYETSVSVELNTYTVIDLKEIAENIFDTAELTGIYGDSIFFSIDADKNIGDYLNEDFTGDEKHFFGYRNSLFEFEFVPSEYKITVTEYFDLSNMPDGVIRFIPQGECYKSKYYPYGTVVELRTAGGWYFKKPFVIILSGPLSSYISGEDDNSFNVSSGTISLTGPVFKSEYSVIYPRTSGLSLKINSSDVFSYTGKWVDDEKLTAEISADESFKNRIFGSKLRNLVTDDCYDMMVSGDGKNVTAVIDTSVFNKDYTDGEKFALEFETIPDSVNCKTYIADDNGEKFYKDIEFGTSVNDSDCFIEISPVLYEDGVVKYIVDSYEINGKVTNVDAKKLYDDGKLSSNMKIPYGDGVKVIYKEVSNDTEVNWKATGFDEPGNSNLISGKFRPFMHLLDFNNESDKSVIYDVLYHNANLYSNEFMCDQSFEYTVFKMEDIVQSINVKSIIYYSNGEFHNMLQEPLYFYFDNHAPEIEIENKDKITWKNQTLKFSVRADDREEFSESDKYSSEVNEIYRNINGSYSEISEISVSGNRFLKENGKWILKESPDGQKYTVNVTDNKDGSLSVVLHLTDEVLTVFEKNIEVTVTDSCGNTSEPENIDLKIESEVPFVSSVKIENPVYYKDSHGIDTAAVGIEGRSESDRVYVDIAAGDRHSGISKVSLIYNGITSLYQIDKLKNDPLYKFRGDDKSCSFRIPLDASENKCSDLRIVVTDVAGNSELYFYTGNDSTPSLEKGTAVFLDGTAPDVRLRIGSVPDFADKSGPVTKEWYSKISEINLSAGDTEGTLNTGVRFLEFDVNGKVFMSSDLIGKNTDKIKITGEHHSDNTDIADLYYSTDENSRTKITTVNLADTDGELALKVRAYDAAGNVSAEQSVTEYIDSASPESAKNFTLMSGTVSCRKFGTFLNHSEIIRVKVNEPDGRPSSGLKSAVLVYADNDRDYVCNLNSAESTSAEFVIPADYSADNCTFTGTARIILTDNVGNRYVSDALVNEKGSDIITFESSEPDIDCEIISGEADYTDKNGINWFKSETSCRITVNDEAGDIYSGIDSVAAAVNGIPVYENSFASDSDTKMKVSDTFEFTAGGDEVKPYGNDGLFSVLVHAYDNAGNRASNNPDDGNTGSFEFAIDKTAPEITGISLGEDNVERTKSAVSNILSLPFGHFFRESQEITVSAFDAGASSGLKEIELTLIEYGGTAHSELCTFDSVNEDGVYTAVFTVPEDFKGFIVAEARDNVLNSSEKYITDGFVTESRERHQETSAAGISIPETEYRDIFGLPLYSSDFDISFYGEDSFSGIRSFEMKTSETGDKWGNLIPENYRKITADMVSRGVQNSDETVNHEGNRNILSEISGWNPKDSDVKTEGNLIVSVKTGAALTKDINAETVQIRLTDNAGNEGTGDIRSFSIDKTPPAISVTYDEAKSDSTSGIYSDARTAYVSVNERNFDPDRISVNAEGNSGGVSFGSWSLVSGTEGSDAAVYRMPVTFSGNGEYVLTAEGTDMGNNQAQEYKSEKFVIDRTSPELEVISSGAELRNGFCWNSARTVTVKITEHNFDASRIKITGTLNGSSDNFPEVSEFTSSGDVHTAVIVFAEDADYTLSILGEDAAGNSLDGYYERFTVDSRAPEIVFEGVKDRSANNGDVSLSVYVREKNADGDMISVGISGANRGDVSEMAGAVQRAEGGFRIIFDEFEKTRKSDDIYTVTVHAEDKAGHESDKTLVFSVNRFGSTYVFEESTLAIAGSYIRKPVDCVMHEINVDPLDEEKTLVKVVRDNDTMVLSRDEDYTVEPAGGEGSWYDYRYVIKAENFAVDAAYRIEICTVDAAGNKNANSIDEKKAELKFGVDQTPPKCIPVNIEKNGSYRMDEMNVQFICEDNIMMKSVGVAVDGKDITDTLTGDGSKYGFTLLSADEPYNINFTLTDIAGNETELLVDNVLISTSYLRIIFHKLWQQVIPIGVSGGLIAWGITSFVRRKKEK